MLIYLYEKCDLRLHRGKLCDKETNFDQSVEKCLLLLFTHHSDFNKFGLLKTLDS